MTTTILLIRHGQTDWNAESRWQGHLDIPLNDTGKAQAAALAQRLAGWPIRAVYSSDLKRAAMTAVTLANALNQQPIFDPRWRERDVGDFGGLTSKEAKERFPEAWTTMKNGLLTPPNGEDWRSLRARAAKAFESVAGRHEGEMVAVVSHGGTLANVVAHVLEIPVDRYGRFRVSGNTGLSIVEITEERGPYLTLLNDTSHLEKLIEPTSFQSAVNR
ncbi:MAG: histidine phosphatase family protein [Ardenticatenaceae bacterium]|nr:histidine phosphatase family protein [Ardenticatenaceae bacterium]